MSELRKRLLESVDNFESTLDSLLKEELYQLGYKAWDLANTGNHPTGSNYWMIDFIDSFVSLVKKEVDEEWDDTKLCERFTEKKRG